MIRDLRRTSLGRVRACACILAAFTFLAGCGTTRYGLEVDEVSADTLRPRLSWQPFSVAEGGEVKIADVTYELKVFRVEDGKLAYAREGIETTEHLLEESLEAGTEYRWAVRPRFTFRGHRRVGPWSRRVPRNVDPRVAVIPISLDWYASFRTTRSDRRNVSEPVVNKR